MYRVFTFLYQHEISIKYNKIFMHVTLAKLLWIIWAIMNHQLQLPIIHTHHVIAFCLFPWQSMQHDQIYPYRQPKKTRRIKYKLNIIKSKAI